jgi:predicted MFS family arabinose efflux permease
VHGGESRVYSLRPAYKYHVLAVLLCGYTLNSFDRSILSLLLEPIGREFGASDTQLGLLSGLAFAVFYSTLAIPVAALADRWHRRNVIVLSALLWTLMTALCGMAGSFMLLLFARMGVGMGEAGAGPASHALLSGYFPKAQRATALGIFALGAPAGTMLAGLFGGWGGEHLGWRTTLLLAAAPGLLLVPLLLLSVAEPPRAPPEEKQQRTTPLREVLVSLWSNPSFRHLCIACGLHSAAMYGAYGFNPSYLTRAHEWSGTQVGQLVAMTGVTGLAGTFLGGLLADRLGARFGDPRWQLWVPGIATVTLVPVQMYFYLGSGVPMVVALLLSSLLSLMFFGPSYATAQSLATAATRAVAAAMVLFFKAAVGMALGPLLVGMASDLLAPVAQANSLQLGLLLVPLFNLWAGLHFFHAARCLGARRQSTPATPAPAPRVA